MPLQIKMCRIFFQKYNLRKNSENKYKKNIHTATIKFERIWKWKS